MKHLSTLLFIYTVSTQVWGQVFNTVVMDSTQMPNKGKFTLSGYLDAYYVFDFNKPPSGDRPYFVSMARHNEVTINLAYLEFTYTSPHLRLNLTPGLGTYMNANYASEPGTLKNILEASAGINLWQTKNIWIDAGVFEAPYTNESAISKNQLAYTRSFSSEYTPYYLSGIKLTIPLSKKLNAYLFLINGWQQINDQNKSKSIGTQLEYQLSKFWQVNWNTYLGNEESTNHPEYRTRYFSDIYFIHKKERWSATGCIYYGVQERNNLSSASWWQANLISQYGVNNKISIVGRIEYFSDPDEVQVNPITNSSGFSSFSSSIGMNLKVTENALFRIEGRTFFSSKDVYERNNNPVKDSNLLATNLTVWF